MVSKEGVAPNKEPSKYRYLWDISSSCGFLMAFNWIPKKLAIGPREVATQGP